MRNQLRLVLIKMIKGYIKHLRDLLKSAGRLLKMPFTNTGRQAVRNWLAQTSTSSYPSVMLWGTASTPISNVTDSTLPAAIGKTFTSIDTSVTYQATYEGIVLSTEATTSTFRKIGIGTHTSGTSGTLFLTEDINAVAHTDQFDLQTLQIVEVAQ